MRNGKLSRPGVCQILSRAGTIAFHLNIQLVYNSHRINAMNSSDFVAVLLLPALPNCSLTVPVASFKAVPRAVSVPVRLPDDCESSRLCAPNPSHLPDEGSGTSPTFAGIRSASGAMDNAASAMVTTSWEPAGQSHPPVDRFFVKPGSQVLKVGSVTLRHPLLPRARRSC
jgi:hypothetical protein